METKDVSWWRRWSFFVYLASVSLLLIVLEPTGTCGYWGASDGSCLLINQFGLAFFTAVVVGGLFNWILP